MTTRTLSVLCAMATFGLTALNPAAWAADETAPKQNTTAPQAPAGRPLRSRSEVLAKELNLTDAQKAKLTPILKEQAEKQRELRQNQNLSAEEKRAKLREMRTEFGKHMKDLLTAEQFEKWQKQSTAGRRRQASPAAPAPKTQ